MTKLVRHFDQKGFRVATLKHHSHTIPLDEMGKDTWRHREAGAKETLLVAGNRMVKWTEKEEEIRLREAMEEIRDADLLLIEGFKEGNLPKLLLLTHPAEMHLARELRNVILVVASFPLPPSFDLPSFHRDETEKIITELERRWPELEWGNVNDE